ncbi:MAG: hypothetical protein WC047_00515 [Kiritimatiellales bacterium]
MKVYNSVTIDMSTGETISEDSYEYHGDVALCGGGGGGGNTNTIQEADPWVGQQDYLREIFARANTQSKTPQQYFPGSTVTPFSSETEQALQMQAGRAINGSAALSGGNKQLTDTLRGDYLTANPAFDYLNNNARGDYLNKNPYIDETVGRALGKVRNSLDSQFASGGRYGSGLHQTALAGAYGDTAASMYGQNYANERQNQIAATGAMGQMFGDERTKQMQAMQFAPQMANQEYVDAQQLANVGETRESLAQAQLTDELNRWNFDQNAQDAALNRYAQLVQGQYGGTTSTSSMAANPTNRLAGTAGGALAGAYLGSAAFGTAAGSAAAGAGSGATYGSVVPGWGTAIGAGIGALGGYLMSK